MMLMQRRVLRPFQVFALTLLAALTSVARPAGAAAERGAVSKPVSSKLSPVLSEARDALLAGHELRGTAAGPSRSFDLVRSNAAGELHVYVRVADPEGADGALLAAQGLRIEQVSKRVGVVQGWISAARLDAIAALPYVSAVTPAVYAQTRAGSVTTAGDHLLGSDKIRDAGFDGTGIKVGIISDGIDSLAVCKNSGDCPDITVIGGNGSGDEGTATIQVVHDIAPGAAIGFCSGGEDNGVSTVDFTTCADKLANEFGAKVIVDDLGFPAEPYFEDGVVALTVAEAVAGGVVWVTASGNDGKRHYQNTFVDSGDASHDHNFGGGAISMPVDVRPGGGTVFLEWANPFEGATDSYQACLTNEAGTEVPLCSGRLLGNEVPLSTLALPCAGPDHCTTHVLVRKVSGEAVPIEMFFIRSGPLSFGTSADSIYGHPAVPRVMAVNAINAADEGLDTPEDFNSLGNVTILFPAEETRPKPDVTALDGVEIVGPDGQAKIFNGTSAAAPHVAGLAALLAQAFPAVASLDLLRAIGRSSVDLGSPGLDPVFGAGRIEPFAAARFLDTPPESVISAPTGTIVVAPGSSASFAGACADPDGAAGLSAAWDFGAGSGVEAATVLVPGELAFRNTGTFQVTFTCTDVFQKPDPTPATVTVVVGIPPVGTIDDPPADLTIVAGESVSFSGSCTDSDSTSGLKHRWTFGANSGIPDSTVEDPGSVTFANPGIFTVTYSCTDQGGATDPTPPTRIITVNGAPESTIDSPSADVTISKGGTVDFAGTCVDTDGTGASTTTWTFGSGSGIADSTVEDPGTVTFGKAGTFTVTFTCKDDRGIPDASPATRTVTVTGKKGGGGGGCSVASNATGGAGNVSALVLALAALVARRRGARSTPTSLGV